MSSSRIPEFRYRSSLIFGDNDWHTVAELSQLDLSEENPNTFYVGMFEFALNSLWNIKSNISLNDIHTVKNVLDIMNKNIILYYKYTQDSLIQKLKILIKIVLLNIAIRKSNCYVVKNK